MKTVKYFTSTCFVVVCSESSQILDHIDTYSHETESRGGEPATQQDKGLLKEGKKRRWKNGSGF